jgi:hypothetical protein
MGNRVPLRRFDEPSEDNYNLIQPGKIKSHQASQSICFFFVLQKANDLHPMGHNIIGNFPKTEPSLFSWPRNIAERGTSVIRECSQDFSYVA